MYLPEGFLTFFENLLHTDYFFLIRLVLGIVLIKCHEGKIKGANKLCLFILVLFFILNLHCGRASKILFWAVLFSISTKLSKNNYGI